MTRLRGVLSDVGRLFGLLQFVEEAPVIDIVAPPTFWRGETRTLRLTVTDDADARVDLTAATAIEFQIKSAPGAADPALVAKALGDGVTLLTQTGETIGQADIVIAQGDTTDATAMPAGVYWLDAVVVLGGVRSLVQQPLQMFLRDTVNS